MYCLQLTCKIDVHFSEKESELLRDVLDQNTWRQDSSVFVAVQRLMVLFYVLSP